MVWWHVDQLHASPSFKYVLFTLTKLTLSSWATPHGWDTKQVFSRWIQRRIKQKQIKFENIDLEIYCSSARCAAFMMTKDLILNWVRAFLFNYHKTLMDYNYLVEWNDRPSNNRSTFQEIEIKIYKVDPPMKAAPPPICLEMPQTPTGIQALNYWFPFIFISRTK